MINSNYRSIEKPLTYKIVEEKLPEDIAFSIERISDSKKVLPFLTDEKAVITQVCHELNLAFLNGKIVGAEETYETVKRNMFRQ